ALTLTALLCVAQPETDKPSAEEQKALDALKALGIKSNRFAEKLPPHTYPPGTMLGYQPDPKAAPRKPWTAEELEPFAKLPRTRDIYFEDAPVGDAFLDLVAKMPDIRSLNIQGSRITDKGLKKLVGLKKLALLMVDRTDVTDEGIAALAGIPSLGLIQMK